jgi:transcriptional regulator with XRE-family HTH domain
MALLPISPRTRQEEILRARGLTQADFARRAGWHLTMANRIITGRTALTPYNRGVLARILACSESALYEKVGTPIEPPITTAGLTETFPVRLAAVVAVLAIGPLEGVLQFLASGDYSGLSADGARRIRNAMEPPADE